MFIKQIVVICGTKAVDKINYEMRAYVCVPMSLQVHDILLVINNPTTTH